MPASSLIADSRLLCPWLQMAMALLLGGYILVRDRAARGQPTATWHGWSADALKGWPTYMRWAVGVMHSLDPLLPPS